MASTGTATPGEYASDRSRWVAIGLVAMTSSLPGRPTEWNWRASCSVKVGRGGPERLDMITPLRWPSDGPGPDPTEPPSISQGEQGGADPRPVQVALGRPQVVATVECQRRNG